jgi:hypothetical protein
MDTAPERSLGSFAEANHIPVVRLRAADAQLRWVPIVPAPHAACEYSRVRPPSRSRLQTRAPVVGR